MGRILIIDDEPILRHSTRLLLEPFGHEVLEGSNGLSGVHLAQEQHPDVIVLDLMMPMMNGHEVLQILSDDPDTSEIPVVILTAVTSPEVHRVCIDEGAVQVFTKPFDPEAFAESLGELIAARATA